MSRLWKISFFIRPRYWAVWGECAPITSIPVPYGWKYAKRDYVWCGLPTATPLLIHHGHNLRWFSYIPLQHIREISEAHMYKHSTHNGPKNNSHETHVCLFARRAIVQMSCKCACPSVRVCICGHNYVCGCMHYFSLNLSVTIWEERGDAYDVWRENNYSTCIECVYN